MRLDHLLSKEKKKECDTLLSKGLVYCLVFKRDSEKERLKRLEENRIKASGGDALRGNTRTHPEHDG